LQRGYVDRRVQDGPTAIEQAALAAYRAALARGMPETSALNVAVATWYAHEPFTNAGKVRNRLTQLLGLKSP
jgi:hypothetical protein